MRKRLWYSALILALVVATGSLSRADDAPASDAPRSTGDSKAASEEKKSGPITLFDGKSLKNWEITDFGGQGSVIVRDGQLILEPGQPLTGITWKGEKLPTVNYEVEFEAQRKGGNDFFVALTFPFRKEFCTLILGGWGGSVTGLSSIDGFDASENSTTDVSTFENGKWYKVRLRVTDDRIKAWVDGQQILDVYTSDKRFTTRIEVDPSKPFGLASYQSLAAYRNMKLRPLSEAESKPEEESDL